MAQWQRAQEFAHPLRHSTIWNVQIRSDLRARPRLTIDLVEVKEAAGSIAMSRRVYSLRLHGLAGGHASIPGRRQLLRLPRLPRASAPQQQNGLPTNAILGSSTCLLKLVNEERPEAHGDRVRRRRGRRFATRSTPTTRPTAVRRRTRCVPQLPYVRKVIEALRLLARRSRRGGGRRHRHAGAKLRLTRRSRSSSSPATRT